MKTDVRQIILSNGQELLCEVVQWPDINIDEDQVMIIRRSAKIIIQENFEQGTRWFTFRPFMTYQDDNNSLVSLMPYHIMSIGHPSRVLKNQYKKYIKLMLADTKAADPFEFHLESSTNNTDSDDTFNNILPFKIDPNKLN
jgi:hypothetical protein